MLFACNQVIELTINHLFIIFYSCFRLNHIKLPGDTFSTRRYRGLISVALICISKQLNFIYSFLYRRRVRRFGFLKIWSCIIKQLDWLELNYISVCRPVYLAIDRGFPNLLSSDILLYLSLDFIEDVWFDFFLAL